MMLTDRQTDRQTDSAENSNPDVKSGGERNKRKIEYLYISVWLQQSTVDIGVGLARISF